MNLLFDNIASSNMNNNMIHNNNTYGIKRIDHLFTFKNF